MDIICLFVCSRVGSLLGLTNQSVFAEFPRLLMRHKAIEMVCAHIGQGREPPPHHGGVLGMLFIFLPPKNVD